MEQINSFRKERFENLFMMLGLIAYEEMTTRETLQDVFNDLQKGMPPEYIKRRRGQGVQLRFRFRHGVREVQILTTYVKATGKMKEKYHGWAFIKDVETGEVLLFSFPILKTESFFEIIFEYAQAFKDICVHWPVCPQCGKALRLDTVEGILNIRKFECHEKTRHNERRPSFWITEGPFSKQTIRFLKAKFLSDVRRQLANKKACKNVQYRRVMRSVKRKQANIAAVNKQSS